MSKTLTIAVIGGGAAGFFGAIACAQANPQNKVILLEKTRQLLSKVRISGGGRCNVTHACFDPKQLVQNYPRGSKALLGPFTKFQPRDTIEWFESRGVALKVEQDGRMFPITDSSETIINCLLSQAKKSGVQIRTECGVNSITQTQSGFILNLGSGEIFECQRLLLATGSNTKVFGWLQGLGHTIEPPVPSLFTFNIPDSPFQELSGISIPKVIAKILNTNLEQTGPILITHWGFSGPAILKLSAWGARILHNLEYQATLQINWLPDYSIEQLLQKLQHSKKEHSARLVATECPFDLPRNFWKKILSLAEMPEALRWSSCSNKHLQALLEQLHSGKYLIKGKSTYKEEFVTCGGVKLEEVNFKTMESRICPGLYFAGEVLDIDGVTGGFNFQNAWTTSWLAANAMSE